jgi:peptide/nickel transport system permease protein
VSPTDETVSEQEGSPFGTISDHSVTREDRIRRALDEFVTTPFSIIWSDIRARVGLLIIVFYVLLGTVGVALVHEPSPNQAERMLSPFEVLQYPLGADALGRGIFAQLVHATPNMLKIMLAGGLWVIVLGTVLGMVAGYKGGKLDTAIMFTSDSVMMLPGLPLLILVLAILKPEGPIAIGLTLAITGWAGLARAIRSEMLSLREENYVEASRIMGLDTGYIMKNDLLPNIMPYVLINLVNSMKGMIFAYMGLSFLGVVPFTNLNWGVMLNNAYRQSGALYTWDAAHWLIAPMLTIMLLAFGLVMFAQGCDRIFNPRVRARHESHASNEADGGGPTPMEGNTS